MNFTADTVSKEAGGRRAGLRGGGIRSSLGAPCPEDTQSVAFSKVRRCYCGSEDQSGRTPQVRISWRKQWQWLLCHITGQTAKPLQRVTRAPLFLFHLLPITPPGTT